jgi:hypothetical protein
MPDLATILERESRRVRLEAGAFERVRRLRLRRQRNRRLGAAVLAIAVTLGALGYAWTTFHEQRTVPMNTITVENVDTLGTAWSIRAASEFDPQVGGDEIWTIGWGSEQGNGNYVVQSVPLTCASGGQSCAPQVIATPGPSFNYEKALLIGRASIYVGGGPDLAGVVGSSGAGSQIPASITAYPQSCEQEPCRPIWKGLIPPTSHHEWLTPVEEFGDRLLATTTRSGMLVAFDTGCQRTCMPEWTARDVGLPTLTGNVVIARMATSLAAFDRSCWSEHGPMCTPTWTIPLDRAAKPLTLPQPQVVGDLVLSSDARGIVAAPIDCPKGCAPRWTASIPGGSGFSLVVADGVVVAAAEGGSDLFAFPLTCRGRCAPRWEGHVDSGVGFEPTLSGDVVTATSALAPSMSAFALSCSGTCAPSWVATLPDSVLYRPTAENGLIYVPGTQDLSVFPDSCTTPCQPVSIQAFPGGAPLGSAVVDGNTLLVIGGGFQAFALQPGLAGQRRPDAGPRGIALPAIVLVVASGALVVALVRRRRLAP